MKKQNDSKMFSTLMILALTATLATYIIIKIRSGYVRPMRLTYSFIYD